MKDCVGILKAPIFCKEKNVSFYGKMKIFFLVLLALNSMQPYFLWAKGIIVSLFCVLLFSFQFIQYLYIYRTAECVISHKNILPLCSWILIYTYLHIIWAGSIKTLIMDTFVCFYPTMTLILCPNDEKKYFLNCFTILVSVILSVSLLFYFMWLFGMKLPSYKIYHPYGNYEYFDNYRFFIVVYDIRNFFIPRFQSVFVEPGHLGMFCSFLLYANGFNIKKKRCLILIISSLLTMSLASYLLLIIGLLAYLFFKSDKKLIAAIILVVFVIAGIGVGTIYYKNHPDSGFSKAILSRLRLDEEKGIAGNNRNTKGFTDDYNQMLDRFDEKTFFGYGSEYFSSKFTSNSSYKVFIYEYGLLGIGLIILLYMSIFLKSKGYVYYGMMLLYIAAFIQRPYALWFCELYVFIAAGYVLKKKQTNKIKLKKNNVMKRFLCLVIK